MNRRPVLRIITGLLLVASVLVAGALPRSPWIVAPLALVFTAAFVVGRWRAWALAWPAQSAPALLGALASTLAVQATMVAVLYLIGRGVAAVLGRPGAGAFTVTDAAYSGMVAAVGLGLGGVAVWRERHLPPGHLTSMPDPFDAPTMAATDVASGDIRLLPEPVTLRSFYAGIHYSHARYDEPGRIYNGTPNADSAGSEAKIAAAEARLGIAMPEALRALYLTQNGGSINKLCVPNPGVDTPRLYEEVVMPFSGYDDLLPCERLRTVFDSTTDFADPDDPEQQDMFPEGGARLVILAQWYRHTLFLDYSAGDAPSVGFVDFDHVDWRAHCVRWPSFEAFFAALRHYETV